jgi:hypothetical protein
MSPRYLALPKRAGVAVVALAVLTCTPGCKSGTIVTRPLQHPVVIDGKVDDWQSLAPGYAQGDSAELRLAIDSTHLYVLITTTHRPWVHAIRLTGIAILLNANGSRDRDYYLRFVGGPANRDGLALSPPRPRSTDGPDATRPRPGIPVERWAMPADTGTVLLCFVRDWIVEKVVPTDGAQGPSAAYGQSGNVYAYEFAVPLGKSDALYYRFDTGPGTTMGIGIRWGDLDKYVLQRETASDGTDPFAEPGSVGENVGIGGRPGAGGGPPPPPLPEKQEIWFKSELPARNDT